MSATPFARRIAIRRALLVAALVLLGPAALVQNSSAQQTRPFPAVRLAARAHGAAIPQALGSRLADVAAFYGMSAGELEEHARSDRGMFAEVDGRLGYACEGLVVSAAPAEEGAVVEPAPYPYDQTFLLHSVAGANRVIFLDFDGHVTSGTQWNSTYEGGHDIITPPFDTDGNPASFSDAERAAIQEVWQRVSEDYAPFEIDVTTEDPGLERLRKTASTDLSYGVRVCIGGSSGDWFGAGAGGVAYVGSFNWNSDTPCFVFPAQLGSGYPKYVAEATSHEAGHTLGLSHDGTTRGVEYYEGQGNWAPIMGVGYYREITQWSKGEYAYANNIQDDLAVMLSYGAVVRYSDYGDTPTDSHLLDSGTTFAIPGDIERTNDVDAFEFQSGPGTIYISVAPSSPSPNLDVLGRLYDSAGNLIASANPSALGLSLTATVPLGTYHLLLEGVGAADPLTNGYSDYGSLGMYTLNGSVPDPGESNPPLAVASADPTTGTAPLAVAFSSAGSVDPNGSIVAYDWDFGDGSPHSSEPNPTHTFTFSGNFACGLTVTNDRGLAAFDTVRVSVVGPPAPPSNLAASAACDPSDPSLGAIALSWRDNSSNEDGFEIEQSADGVTFVPVGAQPPVTGTSFTHTGLAPATPMFYRVRAVNGFGPSGYTNVASATTMALPVAPALAAAMASASQINLSWNNVANETGYQLERSLDGVSGWTQIAQLAANATSFNDTGRLSLTTYFYRIRALGPCSFATGFSAVAQAMTSGTLTTPGSLAVKSSSWTRVNLTWVDKSNNEQGFNIQRSNVKTFAPFVEFNVGANVSAFTDSTVAAKTTYYYRARAFAGTTFSSWTSIRGVTMPADSTQLLPAKPSNSSVTALAGPVNLFKWKDNSAYENGFEIHRSTNSSFAPFTQFLVDRNVISYQDSIGLVKGTKYYYRVRSFNAVGSSAWTSSVSVTASTATAPVAAAASLAPPASLEFGIEAAPAVVRLRNAAPNPFSERSTIAFELPAAAAVDLAIFDVSGRRIASLASGVWEAGRHQAQWNGRDQQGRIQAPGVFFARLSVGRQVMTRKLVLAR